MEKLKAHLKTIGTMISTVLGGIALIIVVGKYPTEIFSLLVLVVITYIFADWYKELYRSFRKK